jgi:hypothetical protein
MLTGPPGNDQAKVEQYTEAVRDIERRIEKAEQQRDVELPTLDQPQGVPPVFEDHLALMLDLQVLAFQSDLTRVITFMIGKEQSARPYPQIGVPEAHHPLSHHNDVPEVIAHLSKINRYHIELFSKQLARLRATPTYRVVQEIGPDHDKRFVVAVTIGDTEWARAVGKSKKEAEQMAAADAHFRLEASNVGHRPRR